MTTLTVAITTNFSADDLNQIDLIDFTNLFGGATATFLAGQFGSFRIRNDVTFSGSVGGNSVIVNNGSVDASQWAFANWSITDTITFNGSTGADVLVGSSQKESIFGGQGNDIIVGSLGGDLLNGGDQIDTLSYIGSNAGINVNLFTGAASGGHAQGDTISQFENLLGTTFDDALTGSAGANQLDGSSGNDVLDGGAEADTVIGGAGRDTISGGGGNDTLLFQGGDVISGEVIDGGDGTTDRARALQFVDLSLSSLAGVEILEFAGGNIRLNQAQIGAGSDVTEVIGDAFLNVLQISAAGSVDLSALTLTNWAGGDQIQLFGGTAGVESWVGSSGTDSMQTSGGADLLSGGGENDIVSLLDGAHLVSGLRMFGGAGNFDIVNLIDSGLHDFTVINLTGFEDIRMIGPSADIVLSSSQIAGGIGRIIGINSAEDSLTIRGGSVSLLGLQLSDWSGAATLSVMGGAGNDTIQGHPAVRQTIEGASGNDTLTGGTNSDILIGGAGADLLTGGLGDDFYVDISGDTVVELAGGGLDTVQSSTTASITSLAHVENILLTGSANANASGNASANILIGNSGANILNGNAGADTMNGGTGNDTYFVDAAGDLTTELFNQGTDLVSSSVSHTLKAHIENLNLSGTANIDGNGNTGANRINGNSGNNILRGDAGADTLSGGDGNDILLGGTGSDSLNPGVDAVRDIIRFSAVGESTGSQRDIVTGMDLTAEDRFDFTVVPTSLVFVGGGALNLATINSDLSAAVDAALALNGAVLFDPGSGDMNVAGHLFVVVDANGDGVYRPNQDYVVQLINSTGFLTLDDFI
jgi:Ca2+-binding RTX toxin-like protein